MRNKPSNYDRVLYATYMKEDTSRSVLIAYPATFEHKRRDYWDIGVLSIRIDEFACYVFLALLSIPVAALPDTVSIMVRASRYLAFGWAAIVFLTRRYYREKSLLPVWLILISAAVATFANWNGFNALLEFVCPIFAAVVLMKYLLQIRGFQGAAWVSVLLSVLLIIQGISSLIGGFGVSYTGNGPYINYFFGMRVEISNIYIFAIDLALIVATRRGVAYKMLSLLAIAFGLYFIFYEQVSTAITTTLVFLLVLLLFFVVRREKIWRYISLLALVVAVIYMFNVHTSGVFEWFLVDLLGESTTLNGRTLIWDQMFSYMDGWHWLLGNGLNSGMLFYLGANNSWSATTAHSQYLNLVFYFGFAGLASYVLLLINQFSITKQLSDRRLMALITAVNIAIVVMGVPTTTFRAVYLYIFYVIITSLPSIVEERAPDGR